jgi:predicted signal transduction protein with EAL and GGDEF domain
VVIFPQEKDSPLSLLQQADTAMYRAKTSGRNAICFFEPTMQAAAQARLTIERDLRLALERGELRMYLQPQVDQTAAIIGAEALIKMNLIKAMGIHLSLDYFGTGYSSLSHLQKLPFSEIKIDRSFITDAPHNAHDAALVEAILALARPNNLQVVAEGVETQHHVDFLKGLSCPIFQGYFYGRPMPKDEFITLMQKQELISRT